MTGAAAGAGVGLVVGACGLASALVANIIITSPMPRQISDGVVLALLAGYIVAVLISGLAAAWAAWYAALRLGGSVEVALALTLPLFAIAAWIALGFISFVNLRNFNDGFPLNSGDASGRGC